MLRHIPNGFPAAIALVLHRTGQFPSLLPELLGGWSPLHVVEGFEGEAVEAGTLTVAPAQQHMSVTQERTYTLSDGRRISNVLSSADPLFASAASAYGKRLLAVVLTGLGRDGADGLTEVKRRGGTVIVQNQATSETFSMPAAARASHPDYILPIDEIGPAINSLVTTGRYKAGRV